MLLKSFIKVEPISRLARTLDSLLGALEDEIEVVCDYGLEGGSKSLIKIIQEMILESFLEISYLEYIRDIKKET